MRSPKALDFMDESALDIEGLTLSPQKEVVRVFYKAAQTIRVFILVDEFGEGIPFAIDPHHPDL